MDAITDAIARYAVATTYEDLPEDVVQAAELRVFDAVGCALGALGAAPAVIAGRRAVPVAVNAGRVLGRSAAQGAAPDAAAFVNTTLIRYLDFNDWSPNGHPSDIVGALLAVANEEGVTGRKVVTATTIAYEVFIELTRASGLPKKGWDQGFALGIATAAGLGHLLDLDKQTVAHAVGILATVGPPTGASRSGELSMWKGSATAFAARNAVFVTLLTRDGMTGPGEAFEGRRGISQLVTGPFTLELGPASGRPYSIMQTALKSWPACWHGQAPVEAAAQLAAKLGGSVTDFAAVEVATYSEAWRSIGSEPAKWDPRSRETADHSMPYLVARSLADGGIGLDSFESAAYLDPALRPLMDRITVVAGDQEDAAYPGAIVATLTARMVDGSVHEIEVVNPPGHPGRPMTEEKVREKFLGLAAAGLGDATRAAAANDGWRHIATADDLGPLLDLLSVR